MDCLFTKYVLDGRGWGIGCLRIHFGECLHSRDIVLGRKPLALVGGKAGKADEGVLNLKEEDDESGLEMEEKLGSLLV